MEQTAATSSTSPLVSAATEDELIVAQILLDLRNLMSLSESLSGFNWVRRKRRSCLEPPKPPAPLTAVPSSPPTSPENRIEERSKAEEAAPAQDEKHGGAARNTSPNTPLSFPPSESDEKHKHSSKKSSKKRSREKYLDTIDELTKRKESLVREIEKVEKYYNKLKADNSRLKAMKQEALNSGINVGMDSTQHQHTSGPTAAHLQDDGLRLDRRPLGIDLNIPAEEAFGAELYQPLDESGAVIVDKRARFAEARRRRMDIMKTKSSRNY